MSPNKLFDLFMNLPNSVLLPTKFFRCGYSVVFLAIFSLQFTTAQTVLPTQLRYEFVFPTVQGFSQAWAGGLNSPQVSTIDLNGDKINDLVLFDRSTSRLFTFLAQNNAYTYSPEYEILFPRKIQNFCLLVDYDNDGKKDIFTKGDFTIEVYRNISVENAVASFTATPKLLNVRSISSGLPIIMNIDATDIPAITDVDNDGDIDVLSFIPQVGQNVEFNRNMSIEKYKKADSLDFEKATVRWGEFDECNTCNDYRFGNNFCRAYKEDDEGKQVLRTEHAGSTQLLIDLNGDGIKDMVLGKVDCSNLSAFINKGTAQNARFDGFMANFPTGTPINIPTFPAAYYEDGDFDGIKDLWAAPNTATNDNRRVNFSKSLWFYKNRGSNNNPNFQLVATDFLQNQMIDVGERAKPIAVDVDADGDLDLLVANGGSLQADNSYKAQVFYFQNTGTNAQPVFRLQDNNLWDFLALGVQALRLSFADLNQDGAIDLIFNSATVPANVASLQYVLNENLPNQALSFSLAKRQTLNLSVRPYEDALFVDLNNDRNLDILLGGLVGNLSYYENQGNLNFSLITSEAGGLGINIQKQVLSVAVADVTDDNQLDLITGDASGKVQIYDNFIKDLRGTFKSLGSFIRHKISGVIIDPNFGREVCPAVWGKNIVLGLGTGGVHFLQRQQVILGNDDPNLTRNHLQVYPNPTTNELNIRSEEEGSIQIFNLLGQGIGTLQNIQAHQIVQIVTENWAKGVYLLQFTAARNGQVSVVKVKK